MLLSFPDVLETTAIHKSGSKKMIPHGIMLQKINLIMNRNGITIKDAVAALENDDFEGALNALASIRDEADCWQMSLYCSARMDEAKGWNDSAVRIYGMIPDYLDSETRKSLLSADYYDYSMLEDGTLCITAYRGEEEIVNVPEVIDGKTVTVIGNGAFRGNRNIKYITLPSTLVSIGEYAFAESGVGYISIPEGITEIPAYCFADSRLFEAKLPESLTVIGDHAFDTINLHFLKVPDNVTYIGSYAISGGYGAETHVYLPASVIYIYRGRWSASRRAVSCRHAVPHGNVWMCWQLDRCSAEYKAQAD